MFFDLIDHLMIGLVLIVLLGAALAVGVGAVAFAALILGLL